MLFERFTDRARKAMQLANQEAQRFNHEYIGTEHILLGLLKEKYGVAAKVLKNLDVDLHKIRLEVEKLVQSGLDMVTMGELPLTPRARQALSRAIEELEPLNHNYVGTEHMLLGLLREPEGVAYLVLNNLGLEPTVIRREVLSILGHNEDGTPVSAAVPETHSGCPSHRILDAAANRASEGLRVVEDYVRFVLDDGHLTGLLKQLRHDLGAVLGELPVAVRHASRDTQADVGTAIGTEAESSRPDTWAVCQASLERSKQSLRSLEEFSKVETPAVSAKFEQLRYRLYTLEKALSGTSNSRSRLSGAKLCVLVDGRDSIEEFEKLCGSLITASVGMIQLRDKGLADRELIEHGKLLVANAKQSRTGNPSPSPSLQGRGTTMVIINDRPDIAATVDADGVHLGQDDMSVKDARAIVGPHKLIGVSTHNIEQARAAVLDGANYLGAGPTFPSATKKFDEFPGLDYLREVAAEISLPTFAIGGIGTENVAQVLKTGVRRVAVSSAVLDAAKPASVVESLLAEIERAL